jgi:hypothetical protein
VQGGVAHRPGRQLRDDQDRPLVADAGEDVADEPDGLDAVGRDPLRCQVGAERGVYAIRPFACVAYFKVRIGEGD